MMKLKKGFAVAMAAGVLTTGGLGVQATVFSATAFAQGGTGPFDQGTPADADSTDDDSALAAGATTLGQATIPDTVKLTIHKFGDNPTEAGVVGKNNRGLELSNETVGKLGDKLSATFSVQKINQINLTTNEGWKKAEALQAAFDATGNAKAVESITNAGYNLGTAVDMTTGDAQSQTPGVATQSFANGLYLVTEKTAPSGYKISVKPFIVALPMTNPVDRTKWLDNVHVYPKNEKQKTEEPTKSVKDGGVQAYVAGNKVEYAISQKIVDGDKYNKFSLIDFYPKDRLETPAELSVKIMNIANPANPTEVEPLVAADFTGADVAADGRYTITLTDSGLKKVNAKIADPNLAVVATFKMTVKENGENVDATEPIMNKFKTIVGRENQPEPPKDPTDPNDPNDPNKPPSDPQDPNDPNNPFPRSYYGNVDIQKKSSNGTTDLKDAEFDLYKCESADALATAFKQPQKPTALKHVVVADTTSVEITGLLATNYQDGSATTTGGKYCLVETKAPEGHELLAAPIDFEVVVDTNGTIPLTPVKVVDSKSNGGFDLPLTGGKGVFALLLAGAAFLVLGRGYSVYAGRRKDA